MQALARQLRSSPNSLGADTEYPLDRVETTNCIEAAETTLGTGCLAAGRTTPMRHSSILRNYGDPGMSYWQMVTQIAAPDAGQPGVPAALSNGVEVTCPRGPIITLRAASGIARVDANIWPSSHRLSKGVALVPGLE